MILRGRLRNNRYVLSLSGADCSAQKHSEKHSEKHAHMISYQVCMFLSRTVRPDNFSGVQIENK